jgi:hypothetical protein
MFLAIPVYRYLSVNVAFLSHLQSRVVCTQVIDYPFIVGSEVQTQPSDAQQQSQPHYRQNPTSVIGMSALLARPTVDTQGSRATVNLPSR